MLLQDLFNSTKRGQTISVPTEKGKTMREKLNDAAVWFENRAKNTPMPGARGMFEMAAAVLREKANGVTMQEWISVKDRLPDTAERVLVCKTWRGRVYKPEYGYYQDFPNQKGCWYVLTEYGYYPQREVTHWMPLPQPPKGE